MTYDDTWTWRITENRWYLLDLVVQFRDPQTKVLLAIFESYGAALESKPPPDAIAELLGQAFTPR